VMDVESVRGTAALPCERTVSPIRSSGMVERGGALAGKWRAVRSGRRRQGLDTLKGPSSAGHEEGLSTWDGVLAKPGGVWTCTCASDYRKPRQGAASQ